MSPRCWLVLFWWLLAPGLAWAQRPVVTGESCGPAHLGGTFPDCTVTSVQTGTAFPGSPTAGDLFIVTDDSAIGACDSNAGTDVTLCRFTGAIWEAPPPMGATQ